MSVEPTAKGQVFVPSESPSEATIWLLRKRSEKKVASQCPAGWHGREMPQNFTYSLELFTYSPSLELLDEHQEMRFKYCSTEICARASWLPLQLQALAPAELGHQSTQQHFQTSSLPQSLPTACCQTLWSIPHSPFCAPECSHL